MVVLVFPCGMLAEHAAGVFLSSRVMELNVAQYLRSLEAALFVIDCLPNMDAAAVTQRTGPLVRYIRERHPFTPIVLADSK